MISIDKLVRSKRRTLSLTIERDGSLLVRAPLRVPENAIREFVSEHEKWILRKQEQFRATYVPVKPKEYIDGEEFLYLGEGYKLRLVEKSGTSLALNTAFELSRKSLPRAAAVFERWYRRRALRVISERVELYAAMHGFTYEKIRITGARTRWGSCSSKGTLSFTWRLVMAPLPVVDYVVIHELVHLKVRNHSKRFWGKVAALMPDYKERLRWLDVQGHVLNLE